MTEVADDAAPVELDAAPVELDATPVDACAGCPANDVPGGAVTINGTITITQAMSGAHDDVNPACSVAGGRDLFYRLVVPSTQLVYLDTAGSSIDTAVTLYPGECTAPGPAMACVDDPCPGATFSQLARSLAAGVYCLVVDEGSQTAGAGFVLDVFYAGRDGTALTGPPPWTVTGDTCTSADFADPACEALATNPGTARDQMYFFTQCGGTHTVTASTCGGAGYDSIVYTLGRTDLGYCVDDGCPGAPQDGSLCAGSFAGTGLIRVIVDGWNSACGTYSLKINP
jgi:hypothetical protein